MILILTFAVCILTAVCYVLSLRISTLEKKIFDDSDTLND